MRPAVLTAILSCTLAAAIASGAGAAETMSTDPPVLLEPLDAAVLTNPVVVRFRQAAHAGHHGGGHLHLLIDAPVPPPRSAVPSDAKHRHLMHGESEVKLVLAPGTHTLQLVAGGPDHRVGDPPLVSPRITIQVTAEKASQPGS